MKKKTIIFFLSLVFVVFYAGNLMVQDAGAASAEQAMQTDASPCACGCGMPGCLCGSGGCGMRGTGRGPMGMGMGMRGAGGCCQGDCRTGMMGKGHGMGRGMGPGAGVGAYGKAGLDATKDLRRQLHMKKFEHFEALRNPDVSDKDILNLEEEMRILKIKIRRKAMQ